MLYVPEGFAHGFLTLEDATEVFYQMSEFYAPAHARGVRWNDPGLRHRLAVEPADDLRAGPDLSRLPRRRDRRASVAVGSRSRRRPARQMHALVAELYPICRSITGDGLRETLAAHRRPDPARRSTRCRRGTPRLRLDGARASGTSATPG